jgi:hypothetical protein
LLWEDIMLHKRSLTALMVTALTIGSAAAFDDSKYPDWSGQWTRPSGVGTQWDQTKPSGLAQHAPMTPEYQARLEASIADQARGGQGEDSRVSCITAGMPRIMTGTRPFELVVLPAVTYVYGENSGMRLHDDNASIIKERFFLDKANSDLLRIEITSIDHALTQPWTVLKTFRRERKVMWAEYDCAESNNHVVVGKEYYFLSGDGYLMPTREDQPPPDRRYFKTAK